MFREISAETRQAMVREIEEAVAQRQFFRLTLGRGACPWPDLLKEAAESFDEFWLIEQANRWRASREALYLWRLYHALALCALAEPYEELQVWSAQEALGETILARQLYAQLLGARSLIHIDPLVRGLLTGQLAIRDTAPRRPLLS